MSEAREWPENEKQYEAADAFTRAYIECALWIAEPEPYPGEYSVEIDDIVAIDPSSFKTMLEDCANFQELAEKELKKAYATGYTDTQAGHDFYLTRNGHGAGFWDRGLKNGDALSKDAKSFGESTLYCAQGDESEFDPSQPREFYLM